MKPPPDSAAKAKPPEESAPEVLEKLVQKAEAARASDIHLQMTGAAARIFFRLDGVLAPGWELPKPLAERVFGRVKFLAKLKTYQDSLPQDGRIDKGELKARNDVRVATYPTVTGEKIVLRLFQQNSIPKLEALGLPAVTTAELDQFLRQTAGLMLLTGPAGSGKTTTIYACLQRLADWGGKHVITVEDPAEQIIPGIMQTEVNEARGLTFAKAARHLLRQDPQVLVLGEIRDDETANLAVRAALTGHLVISTLHAGSCKGVFERLMVMVPDHYAVLSAVALVLNQRLLRRLCVDCSGLGCAACFQTGYLGRVPAAEWLRVDDPVRHQIRQQGAESAKAAIPLEMAAQEILQKGLTNEAELRRIFGS